MDDQRTNRASRRSIELTAKQGNVALRLSYVTVAYNVLEGLVSIAFALLAGSPALLGFGIDSFVESLSGLVMIWRFSGAADHRREKTAVRLAGVSLIVLATYVAYEATTALYFDKPPERSIVGIIIAAVSLVTMPVLYVLKRRVASEIGSRSLATDAKQALACIMLSVALLVGSGLHYTTGLWQADPVAALVIAVFLVREGYKAWKEHELCC
jgi:divalent metal cation (Fe/Co/Zn/Cd) transporter